MQSQHEPLRTELSPAALLQSEEAATPRDACGRTLEQAQQEDSSWREDYVSQVRAQVARFHEMEGRTGLIGVVIASTLLVGAVFIGLRLDSVHQRGWTMEQSMQVFDWLIYGTLGACALGIAGIGLWGWLQETVRLQHRQLGIELDDTLENLEDTPPARETETFTADFRDCGECGYSMPVQAPVCRCCGAPPRPVQAASGASTETWWQRTFQTRSLARTFGWRIKGPKDVLALAVLAVMIILAIANRFL